MICVYMCVYVCICVMARVCTSLCVCMCHIVNSMCVYQWYVCVYVALHAYVCHYVCTCVIQSITHVHAHHQLYGMSACISFFFLQLFLQLQSIIHVHAHHLLYGMSACISFFFSIFLYIAVRSLTVACPYF